MSDFAPRRTLLFIPLFLLIATAALAVSPSARYDARFVYDPVTTHSILFGGATANDVATKHPYEFNDTWDWNGAVWTQLFPLHIPTARYGHIMVYDSKRDRMVMFGGRTANNTQDLNDTWIFKNGDWTQLDTPIAPPARVIAGAAYDPLRDRVVLYGGVTATADNKTTTRLRDTWEFDGTTWTQVASGGPDFDKPTMAWDAARNVILMLTVDSSLATHQFTYDPSVPAWNAAPSTLAVPSCANEGGLVFQDRNNTLFFNGGVCSSSNFVEDDLEWDGEKWNVITVKVNSGRVFGGAMTYDVFRQQVLLFGGSPAGATQPRNDLWAYNGDWTPLFDPDLTPTARSLFVFQPDPVNGGIWLFGGVEPLAQNGDFWKFQYGTWQRVTTTTAPPSGCITPTGAWDKDRQKLVIVCADNTVAEYDLNDWKLIAQFKHSPPNRAWSSMVYDENLKKTVLFGGYSTDYLNETWEWDGTDWTRIDHDAPPQRLLAAMWFDKHLNKTVIFGGLGRLTKTDRVSRFNDMWSFDGTNWTEIKPAHVPPPHYGSMVTIDPHSGNVLLFGGMRVDTTTTPGTGNNPPVVTQTQVYADDFWQWDGTDWTQVTYPRAPYARENGGFAYDSSTDALVIFGGYVGQSYLSDLWTLTPDKGWQPHITNPVRRRSTGRP